MDGVLDFKFYDQTPLLNPKIAQWMDGCLGVNQLTFSSLGFLVCGKQAWSVLSVRDMPRTPSLEGPECSKYEGYTWDSKAGVS